LQGFDIFGQIGDSNIAQIDVPGDLREDGSPHRHFSRPVTWLDRRIAGTDALHFLQRKCAAITDRDVDSGLGGLLFSVDGGADGGDGFAAGDDFGLIALERAELDHFVQVLAE
jgi:hypothetical protein